MRLSLKLALAATLGIAVMLAVYSSLRLRRDAALFDADIRRDHRALAQALALGATVLAHRSGPAEGLAYVAEANEQRSHVQIAWVEDPRAAGAAPRAGIPASAIHVERAGASGAELVTRVPAVLGEGAAGYVEIRESLANRAAVLRDTRLRHVAIAVIVIVLSGVILVVGGWFMLGRPLRPLIDKIHRIGEGDWSGPLRMRQADELGTIAREIDAMCERLTELRERADAEAEARLAALEQLRHAERLATVGKLASGIAHELGTPLNVVAASARLIERGDSAGEDARSDARVVVEQAERMTRIIRQLLDFARTRAPHRRAEELGTLARSVTALLEPLATKSGVSVVVKDDEPAQASVDAGQIQQVLTNLVVNAVQAQPNGGAVRVEVRPPRDGHALIAVEDDGPGVPPELHARIFEPFFTTKDVGTGTGLGLSVAYGIVREHGGRLDVARAPGGGARFEVHLPVEGA